MPQIFKIGSYLIYFWSNEGDPLEPIHVHISEGVPTQNATKVWLTRTGKCLLANNNSKIPQRQLRIMMQIIEARQKEIVEKWLSYYGKVGFYC